MLGVTTQPWGEQVTTVITPAKPGHGTRALPLTLGFCLAN